MQICILIKKESILIYTVCYHFLIENVCARAKVYVILDHPSYSSGLIVGHVILKTRSLGQIVAKQFPWLILAIFSPIFFRFSQKVYLDDLQFRFDSGSRDLEIQVNRSNCEAR